MNFQTRLTKSRQKNVKLPIFRQLEKILSFFYYYFFYY